MSDKLKPCPFCGEAMKVSPHPVNQWAVCPTEGCIGARQTVVLEDPKQVAAWNRRASPSTEGEGGELVERLRSESFTNGDTDIRWKAADEIERLRTHRFLQRRTRQNEYRREDAKGTRSPCAHHP